MAVCVISASLAWTLTANSETPLMAGTIAMGAGTRVRVLHHSSAARGEPVQMMISSRWLHSLPGFALTPPTPAPTWQVDKGICDREFQQLKSCWRTALRAALAKTR